MGKYSLFATKEDYRLVYAKLEELEKISTEKFDWKKIKRTHLDGLEALVDIVKRRQGIAKEQESQLAELKAKSLKQSKIIK